jgi:hypothetical protein
MPDWRILYLNFCAVQVGGKAKAGVGVRVAKACVEWILAWGLDILQSQTIHHLTQFQLDPLLLILCEQE